ANCSPERKYSFFKYSSKTYIYVSLLIFLHCNFYSKKYLIDIVDCNSMMILGLMSRLISKYQIKNSLEKILESTPIPIKKSASGIIKTGETSTLKELFLLWVGTILTPYSIEVTHFRRYETC